MDDGSVITEAKPIEGDRWVVLTPSVDHEAWMKVLARGAAQHGMAFFEIGSDAKAPAKGRPVLYVTHDAEKVGDAPLDRIAVLMPQPETAAIGTGMIEDSFPPYSVVQASLLLARAVALPSPARLFTGAQLARNPEAIALFSGITIHPPQAERGAPGPAVATAFGLFRQGRLPVGAKANWSERLFAYDPGSCIEGAPLGTLDLTGRPRTVLYGPYFALPPGHWEATMRFAVDEAASGHEMCLDWGNADDFVSEIITTPKAGLYELRLDHTATRVELWQFRLIIMEGVFDGRLIFQGGTIVRLPDESDEQVPSIAQQMAS